MLADIYDKEGFSTKKNQQYDKLINENVNQDGIGVTLKQFENSGDNKRLLKVNALLEQLSATADIIKDETEY